MFSVSITGNPILCARSLLNPIAPSAFSAPLGIHLKKNALSMKLTIAFLAGMVNFAVEVDPSDNLWTLKHLITKDKLPDISVHHQRFIATTTGVEIKDYNQTLLELGIEHEGCLELRLSISRKLLYPIPQNTPGYPGPRQDGIIELIVHPTDTITSVHHKIFQGWYPAQCIPAHLPGIAVIINGLSAPQGGVQQQPSSGAGAVDGTTNESAWGTVVSGAHNEPAFSLFSHPFPGDAAMLGRGGGEREDYTITPQ